MILMHLPLGMSLGIEEGTELGWSDGTSDGVSEGTSILSIDGKDSNIAVSKSKEQQA